MLSRGKKNTTTLVSLIVAIFAFWWGVSVLDQTQNVPKVITVAAADLQIDPYTAASVIVVHHSLDANHMDAFSGTITLPSGCDDLGTGIASHGSNPAHVTILLTVLKDPGCTSAPPGGSDQPFSVSLSHAATAPVFDGVTVNGVIVPSKVVEGS